jgi:hypothetical protein
MNKYKTTITQISVHQETESPIYGSSTIIAELDDQASGIFLVIKSAQNEKLSIEIEQWNVLNKAVATLIKQKCEGMP